MSARSRAGIFTGIAVIIVIILIFFSWYIRTRNNIVTLDEDINSAWAEIDNQLQRRSDLIGNLVESVKGVMAQEKEVFTPSNSSPAKTRSWRSRQPVLKEARGM